MDMPSGMEVSSITRRAHMSVLLTIASILLGVFLLVYFGQDHLIFPATRSIYRVPTDPPFCWAYEDVYIKVGRHTTHGWFVPLENARGTVLFSHGNAGNIADRLESIQLLRRLGFSVLVYDYGGYGKSTGRPSEKRIYADVEAMWRHLLVERSIPPEKIVVFGRSLGGAAAAHLSAKVRPAAVVLESTFLSIPHVAREMPGGFLLSQLIRHRFPTYEKVQNITAPLLVIHSPEDSLIPFKHGQQLFVHAPGPKQFLTIHGDHNDGFVRSMEAYLAGWDHFLSPLLPRY